MQGVSGSSPLGSIPTNSSRREGFFCGSRVGGGPDGSEKDHIQREAETRESEEGLDGLTGVCGTPEELFALGHPGGWSGVCGRRDHRGAPRALARAGTEHGGDFQRKTKAKHLIRMAKPSHHKLPGAMRSVSSLWITQKFRSNDEIRQDASTANIRSCTGAKSSGQPRISPQLARCPSLLTGLYFAHRHRTKDSSEYCV
jgi:hypothetical protein